MPVVLEKGAEVYSRDRVFAKRVIPPPLGVLWAKPVNRSADPGRTIIWVMAATSALDALLGAADNALRALLSPAQAARQVPNLPPPAELSASERSHVAGLMRVDHAGEIAAQALYHGQALLARNAETREFLLRAAREEGDHLAWTEQRLHELGAQTSRLNPLWYAGSFVIGAAAAAVSDRLSLGFVTETERQVEGHLDEHLQRLPAQDARSRRILEVMKADEVGHADQAERAGAVLLPLPVRMLMRMTSKLMTRTAYWI
jgi:ubiquinone biosynthesis monooxygenase Coq7